MDNETDLQLLPNSNEANEVIQPFADEVLTKLEHSSVRPVDQESKFQN